MNNIEFIDGMNKEWDLAFRLIGEDKDVLLKMFGTDEVDEIISNNEPQYVLKKLEVYDNENRKEYLPDTNVGNKDGWIPCSEKLPTRYCNCLVTRRNEYEDGFDTGVREDTYVEIEGIWDWQSKHEGLIDEIIAWMPLPEPYKAEGE